MTSAEIPIPARARSAALPLSQLIERVESPGRADWTDIPAGPGSYIVFLPENVPFAVSPDAPPMEVERIRDKWERINLRKPTDILYIGKAASLRQAIRALARFGAGRGGPARGGEWLWQVAPIRQARLEWMECAPGKEKAMKETLLACFLEEHGEWPLANRRYR